MRTTLALCAVAALAGGAAAQSQDAPRQPVFRASTSIVEVTVIVRDGDGRFVRDLTIADFEVREDGAPQQIQTLYLVERPAAAAAPEAPAPGAPAAPVTAPPARRAFVFLFDMDHLSPGGLTRAREAVETFATGRILPTDISAVIAQGAQGGRLSSDHLATLKVAEGLKPRADRVARDQSLRQWPRIVSPLEAERIARNDEHVLSEARDRACEERRMDCIDAEETGGKVDRGPEANRQTVENELRLKASTYIVESRAASERAVGALTQVATALEQSPGRKTLIWMTEGTWAGEIAERAREAAFRASQSGVAVYTIDPRGLNRSGGAGLDAVGAADVGQAFLQDMDDIANVMATGSGGRAIRSENNLGRALGIIEDDTSTYYVLGYAPPEEADRTKYRPLQVRITRDGLDASVRHGFMAPQRTTERTTAPAPERAPERVVPHAPSVSSVPVAAPVAPVEPGTEPTEPTERPPPGVRSDALARIGDLAGGVDSGGRDSGREGLQAYQRGDLEAALPLLERAAAEPAAPAWVHYALGFSYIGVRRPKDAISSWERVVESAPEFAPVYFDLAATYAQVKDFNGALSVLRTAARRWPRDPEVHNAMGVAMTRRGDLDGAVDAFERAVNAEPADPVSLLNTGRAYELRYMRDRRWVPGQKRWVGPVEDRAQAKAYYERCAAIGGPYAELAQDALKRVQWSDK